MNPKIYISADRIAKRLAELGKEVSEHYAQILKPDESVIVIGVLKGAYIFTADLVRQMSVPMQIEFVRIASYGDSTVSSGMISAPDLNLPANIFGKHVLIVEDIVDTGQTANFLKNYLDTQFQPASIKLISFLSKPSRRSVDIEPDLYGFEIEDKFVIGYGLDFAEKYRELPYLGCIEEDAN